MKQLSARQLKRMVAQIESHKNAIVRHRDALRDILYQLNDVVDSSDEGVRGLEAAIDALNQYL